MLLVSCETNMVTKSSNFVMNSSPYNRPTVHRSCLCEGAESTGALLLVISAKPTSLISSVKCVSRPELVRPNAEPLLCQRTTGPEYSTV